MPQVLSAAAETAATPSPARLDAWLRIDGEGNVHVFTGKDPREIGMGVETGLSQVVAEELDVPVGRVVMVMGHTSATTDQGGVGGSTSIMMGAKPLRNAAAYGHVQFLGHNLGEAGLDAHADFGLAREHVDISITVDAQPGVQPSGRRSGGGFGCRRQDLRQRGSFGEAEADQKSAGILDELSSGKKVLGGHGYALLFISSAARRTAAKMRTWLPQRQIRVSKALRICSSVGLGFLSSRALAVRTHPFRQ